MKTIGLGLIGCCLVFSGGCGDPSSGVDPAPTGQHDGALATQRCLRDSDCKSGTVCEGCGTGSSTCVPGCRSNVTCPENAECQRVECFACPCPNQCVMQLPPPLPMIETDCHDGIDNDGDGLIDCADPDCEGPALTSTVTPSPCCYPRCGPNEELRCLGENICGYPCTCVSLTRPETDCKDGVDNDGDGLIDCADPDCRGSASCQCKPALSSAAADVTCCYPVCASNQVLSCTGRNICGYPCTCVSLTPPPCTSDLQCARDQVCLGCDANGSDARCVAGCRATTDCPLGKQCTAVQCVICPCPAQCQ